MDPILLVDFGSTCTKLTAADADEARILGTAQSFTTVGTDIVEGFDAALVQLNRAIGKLEYMQTLACSSAAGGLKAIAVGLVPELTAEAARRTALSAGAKLMKCYSYELSEGEALEIEALKPDIVLLTGGTDGGNKTVILHNAHVLAGVAGDFPVVVAGNKSVANEAARVLAAAGREAVMTANVMPVFNELNVQPARECIRDVFLRRIVRAKGLSHAESVIGGILMPTPLAVLKALELLSAGAGAERGVGELAAVDVGGATTDVYSIGSGLPQAPGVVMKGLPEPWAKRTVEGDIGVRYTAHSLMEAAGLPALAEASGLPEGEVQRLIALIDQNPGILPADEANVAVLDHGLCRLAVRIALTRHAGSYETGYTPMGRVLIQTGKDLRGVGNLIGTGGPVIRGWDPVGALKGAVRSIADEMVLTPRDPDVFIDSKYILAAMGLLGERRPEAAVRILKRELGMEQ